MHNTSNEIVIHGDPDRIYELAAAVEEWPVWLPHYRWVRVHNRDGNRRTVEMAAWRTGLPVHWVSHQWLWPEERRITFLHLRGLSRGMAVEWRIEPEEEPGMRAAGRGKAVHVSITHELRLEVPVVNSRAGQWVVGELFVKAVAGRTLACLKRRVEGEK